MSWSSRGLWRSTERCTGTAQSGERCRSRTLSRFSTVHCPAHLDADERAEYERDQARRYEEQEAERERNRQAAQWLGREMVRVAHEAWAKGRTRAEAVARVAAAMNFEVRTRNPPQEQLHVFDFDSCDPDLDQHQCPSVTLQWTGTAGYGRGFVHLALIACRLYRGHDGDHADGQLRQWGGPWDDAGGLPEP